MLDIGFWELTVAGVVALIVIGPKRLPSVARKAAQYVRQARRLWQNVKQDTEQALDTDPDKKDP